MKERPPDDLGPSGGVDYAITPITPISENAVNKLPEPGEFPVGAMPRACRHLIKEAAASIVCPPEFVALPMLAVLGSAIGTSRTLKLKEGWDESAAIFAAVVADPGEKKTPAAKVAQAPALKRQAELKSEYLERKEEYEEGLREHEADKRRARKDDVADPKPPERPIMERTAVEDTTVEALSVILKGTPRGVVSVRDELSGWVRSMDQYKSGKGADRQFWISVWSNAYASVDRKSQDEPLILQKPFVGVSGSIQPTILPELIDSREDGMLDRFLFAYPDPIPSRWSDEEIGEASRTAYRDLYDRLRELTLHTDDHGDPDPVRLEFSPDAKAVFVDAKNSHSAEKELPGFPKRLGWFWSKLEGYLARLSLILALARRVEDGEPERVEPEDVLKAVALLDYFKAQARRVFARLYGEDPRLRLIEDLAKFLQQRGGAFEGTATELHEQFESRYKPERPDELSKFVKEAAAQTPGFVYESKTVNVEGEQGRTTRRVLRLLLETA
jgi:hypothetical protein